MSQSRSQTSSTRRLLPQRPPQPTTAEGPRAGLVLSLVLHAALIGATYFTWSRMLDATPESHSVPVDLITVTEKTNVAAMAPPPPPTPPKLEIPQPTLEAPPLPQFQQVEPAPEPPMPDIKIAPEPKKVEDTPKPPDKPKQASQDFAALLNKLTATPKAPPNAKVGPRVVQGIGQANAMTADLADALKSQIYQCWSPPVGAPNPSDLVVDFDLVLNQDGTPGRATSDALSSGNTYPRAAAEAARRAIFQCQPYKLPPDRYSQWREISPLRFDPRQMMNQ
jgi:outer membrane biosynthesis protein TonB